ncbi:hypothetical protein [Nocardia sp. NPDC046763]|uniref:hypothetical protein n=1 Tax=Nocardia sp. NPDC046763 TaxID=3155256 RepID=UPI0034064F19
MDPNTALTRIRELIAVYHSIGDGADYDPEFIVEFFEHVEELDGWLSRGGFLPKEWEWARAAVTS